MLRTFLYPTRFSAFIFSKEGIYYGHAKSVILDIQTWIDNNIDKPLRINDVAHRAGYSKWHLQRLFHQIIDIPLGKVRTSS
jgi:transcriptional regulator GlxA family with amidase domain